MAQKGRNNAISAVCDVVAHRGSLCIGWCVLVTNYYETSSEVILEKIAGCRKRKKS